MVGTTERSGFLTRYTSANSLRVANSLPFAFVSRVMFLYHYLPAFIFSIIIGSIMLARLPKGRNLIGAGATALALASFLVLSPLTFGLPVNALTLWLSGTVADISNK